ncbi:uncharacterized protein PRCAT00003007001 [Priceomyces carsonii]|uniref:uncharacterized protein n=1 Tax=Priceomyces carsonii TaxID=28549 RepID=UPI002ED95595|nr:unnamed protein product [Priceomyces carsonii]
MDLNHNLQVIELVKAQNSPDNNLRKQAELDFNNLVKNDPSSSALSLVQIALDESIPIDIRQACLLHLRRIVPQYWSLGFQSFLGPPIKQDVKGIVRHLLLQISFTSTNTKLRKACAYVIVQIASSDYPDEWSDLLSQLYNLTADTNNETSILGGLTVFNDLFDEIIDEEQFWDRKLGFELLNHLNFLLSQERLSSETKTQCIKLYQSIITTFESPEAYTSDERKNAVHEQVRQIIDLFTSLLGQSSTASTGHGLEVSCAELYYRSYIYKVLISILGSFGRRIPEQSKLLLMEIALNDLTYLTNVYDSIAVEADRKLSISCSDDLGEPPQIVSNLLLELLQTIGLLQNDINIKLKLEDRSALFFECLFRISVLPRETIENYESDFNTYVTDINGLSPVVSVRDSVYEFLSELNNTDAEEEFSLLFQALSSGDSMKWQLKEAYLFMIEGLFTNEDSGSIAANIPLTNLLQTLTRHISQENSQYHNQLVTARTFLMLPKFFEKFRLKMSVETFGGKAFTDMILFVSSYSGPADLFNLVKVSVLVCVTLYSHLFNLVGLIDASKKNELQFAILQMILSLVDDSEEDGLPALLEAIDVASEMDPNFASTVYIAEGVNVIDLVFKVAFKDPSNVQLTIDAPNCIKALLDKVTLDVYLSNCDKSLPFIFNIIKSSIETSSGDYSPELYLSLELLGVIINSVPTADNDFPSLVFGYTFPFLKDLILLSNDNQILQSGGEVFNNLLQKASESFINYRDPKTNESGMDLLLLIVSKFLSPSLSDSAAMYCGIIVLSLIKKFHDYLDSNFLSQILAATVKRLIISKEAVTTENLTMVICDLVLQSPQDMINFLCDETLQDPKTGHQKYALALVMPIWFDTFEVTRGYEKIKQNVLALGQVFSLGDKRVESLIVNGDIIPYEGDLIITRSMAREMPDKYTQIHAPLKILKLLCSELSFQCQQPDPNDYLPDDQTGSHRDGDEEDWEDMDDIGVPNYEKLKSYVDSDEEGDEHDDQNGDGSLKEILIEFFKECVTKNLGSFQYFYTQLNDNEKKIITECLVF